MKSILIVSSVFTPEPVVSARISEDIADSISKSYNSIVFAPRPSRPKGMDFSEYKFNQEKYKRIIADSFVYPDSKFIGRMRESFSFGLATYNFIKHNKKDISVIYANTKPLFGVYLTLLAAKRYKIPIILHIQDIYPESMVGRLKKIGCIFKHLFISLDKYFYPFANKILVISDKMKDYLSETRKISKDKFIVVRNWQDGKSFENKEKVNSNIFTYMYVGSISPAAGVDFLINSYIKSSIDNSELVIVGDGSQKNLCMEIVKRNNVKNVYFQSVNPDQVAEIQSKADVLMLSLKKGVGHTASPSKLSAYMLSGKPIIASVDKNSDTDYIITSTKCGYITESEDETALIEAMKRIKKLPKDDLNRMGDNARIFAKENMSKESNLDKIVKTIESVIV